MSGGPESGLSSALQSHLASSSGQDSAAQLRLCSVLPNLDFKPLFKMEELAGFAFFNKNMCRNEQWNMFMAAGNGAALGPLGKILAWLMEELKKGGISLQDLAQYIEAANLSSDDLHAVGDIRAIFGDNHIEGLDANHMTAMIGQLAIQNVAINAAAMHHDDGLSV